MFIVENLETYEVEEFLADILNTEFDTVVDDGSLPQVLFVDLHYITTIDIYYFLTPLEPCLYTTYHEVYLFSLSNNCCFP